MLNRDRVSVWDADNILKVDGGDDCPAMWTYLMLLLNCTLNND